MTAVRLLITIVLFVVCIFLAGVGCSKKPKPLPPFQPRPGSIEICIVANDYDDDLAIEAAKAYFVAAAKDPARQAELKRLAEEGKPPPAPTLADGQKFSVHGEDITYRWVELDPNVFRELELDSPAQTENQNAIISARDQGQLAVLSGAFSRTPNAIWSRTRIANDRDKEIDYFILIRNAIAGKELTEAHLEDFAPGVDPESFLPIISGKFNEEGGERMLELSRNNKPKDDGRVVRQLAIIIQDRVFTIPNLQSAIRDRFQISGVFTKEYVEEVVSRVRTAGH